MGRVLSVLGAALLALGVVLAAAGPARADTLEEIFRGGNEAFFRGDDEGAIGAYERLVELGVRDADVFYNLGSAYGRAGLHGRAIASFERGLRLRPGDAEMLEALERSRSALASRRADREGEAEVESGAPLGEMVFAGVSVDGLASSVLVLEALFFLALLAFPRVRREHVRLSLGVAIPLLAIALTVAGVGLAIRSGAFDRGEPAIVVRDRVPLREGPREDAQERARAREGERAEIVQRDGAWVKLELGPRTGWAPAADVVSLVDGTR